MTDFQALLQRGDAWLYLPSALLLGALHGLEPGHSKSLMASFIVAVRGTVGQAVLLGLAATLSHTAVVWVIAVLGLYGSQRFGTEEVEPVLQGISAVLVFGLGLWMIRRTWREGAHCGHAHGHDHGHDHGHHHGHDHGHPHSHDHDHDHDHDHQHRHGRGHGLAAEHDDHHAHHAKVGTRGTPRQVGNGEIVMFGLTGGLMPCPASVAVLLLCLQVGQVGLGAGMVMAFSVGLALTLMAAGVTAALGAKHLSDRWSVLNALARRAPYLSGGWMLVLGLVLAYQALQGHGHG